MRSGQALEALLPAGVAAVATREDFPDAVLLGQEQAAMSRAVEKRRREFATARACARMALGRWGMSDRAIPMGSDGAPRWPKGLVGSITHCDGYRGCAVASADDLVSIGIDAEPDAPLPGALLSDVAVPEERDWVLDLSRREPCVCWDRLLFCVKEAVYKAWAPLTDRRLGFEHAVVAVDPRQRSFTARLRGQGPAVGSQRLEALAGRWLTRDGILVAAVGVETAG